MKARTLLLVTAGALVLAPAALAKGPAAATVSGPGDDSSGGISIRGDGEGGNGTPLGRLVESGGFFAAAFGQTPNPMLDERPEGALGPKYTIQYRVPGPNNEDDTLVQDVYPYAQPTAVTYMRPGQPFFGTERTRGGWFVGGAELKAVLVEAGLPATAPSVGSGSDGFDFPVVVVPLAALAFFAGLLVVAFVRRQPTPGTH